MFATLQSCGQPASTLMVGAACGDRNHGLLRGSFH
jgi:hypothetical protein